MCTKGLQSIETNHDLNELNISIYLTSLFFFISGDEGAEAQISDVTSSLGAEFKIKLKSI